MRTSLLASLAGLIGIAQLATAQAASPYSTAPSAAAVVDSAPAGAPSVFRRAAAFVSMALLAPNGAETRPEVRDAALAAQDAADAYQLALTDYSAGDRLAADSAARRAIQLARVAVTTMLGRNAAEETTSSGEVVTLPSVTITAPSMMATATPAPPPLVPSYAVLNPLPFGVSRSQSNYLAQRDSLPFGATPVGRAPAPIAP